MTVLALETSGKVMTVALEYAGGFLEFSQNTGFRHGEILMPAVSRVMDQAGIVPSMIDLVVCSGGPGSFTALRIGMATAKGIARGARCAIKAVPTLPLLAAGREHWPGIVVPVMDARKRRVYAAAFRRGERIRPDSDIDLNEFLINLPPDGPVLVTGPDAAIAGGRVNVTVDPLHDSARGAAMIRMGIGLYEDGGSDPPDLGPVYLRLSEAEEALEQRT